MPADLTGKIVLRWDSTANCAPLLEPGGVDAVWLRTPGDGIAAACRAAGAEVLPADTIRLASLEEYGLAKPAETVVAKAGLWPGAQAGARATDGALEAGATGQAWVTANGYLAAWTRMGQTARWLKQHRSLFLQKPMDAVTALVDPGDASSELAALLFRHSASPVLVAAKRAPAPDPAAGPLVVAAVLAAPSPGLQKVLRAHARAEATVVIDASASNAWWRTPGLKLTRGFEDREIYKLGSGSLVAYKDTVSDPGDFALDMIDLVGARRPARVWNLSGGIVTASQAGPGAKAALQVVNYGSPARSGVLVRRYGVFQSATLLRPEDADVSLRIYKRGASTEVVLPSLGRLGVVIFD